MVNYCILRTGLTTSSQASLLDSIISPFISSFTEGCKRDLTA